MHLEEHNHCFMHFLASKHCLGHFGAPPSMHPGYGARLHFREGLRGELGPLLAAFPGGVHQQLLPAVTEAAVFIAWKITR